MKKSLFLSFILLLISALSASAQFISAGPETKRIDGEGLKEIVTEAARQNQPVLINFWATWCGPCREELPELVRIDADYREKGLKFALVSIDNFALIKTTVPEFLRQYEVTMPSYLLDYPSRRELVRAVRLIAPRFPDRYPLTLLFDAKGKLVYRKVGIIDSKILRAQIDKVLKRRMTGEKK